MMAWVHILIKVLDFISNSDINAWLKVHYTTRMNQSVMLCYILAVNNYSGYQHQTPELMSQTQMSQNGVVPTNLANGLHTHSSKLDH